ncbi:MAG TPA: WecB/TagA/CpsF family glycosyltransferase [Solirubrobacteraceae bacterium]|nr:WecB/TagA/CpsF family glycosyltransferase [Solirubrobacteraceae bacterium]
MNRPQHQAGISATTNGAARASEGPRSTSRVFDIPIDLAQPSELLRTITGWGQTQPPRHVMYVNAHVLNQSKEQQELRGALQRADLVYCDGYGVRLAARALGLEIPHRMTGADWVWGLATLCEVGGRSIYLLGSDPPIAREAAERLRRFYPRLEIAGSHHGFFDLDTPHNDRVIEDINARRPDIVLVGMGTPKQELWVDRYADRLDVDVLWTVGALFDYVSGRTPRAPRWLSDNGLEWIFRLGIEPQRMWRRYLLGNPAFLSRVVAETRRAR